MKLLNKTFSLALAVVTLTAMIGGCAPSSAPRKQSAPATTRPPAGQARIGVMTGSTNAEFAKAHFSGATVVEYRNYVESAEALSSGAIDYAMMDYATALNFSKYNATLKLLPGALTDEVTAMALNKKNTELNPKICAVVDQYLSDGTIDAIISHWIREDRSNYQPGAVQKLEGAPELRAAVSTAIEPRCFLDKEGNPTGMAVELVDRIAYDLGMRAVYLDMPFGDQLESLESDDADIIPSMYKTPEREQIADFTSPYFPNPQMFLVKEVQ